MSKILLVRPKDSHDCSYLQDRQARFDYVDPTQYLTDEEIYHLSLLGFRRSGYLFYRPACETCQACTSVRLRSDNLRISRNMKRILKRSERWQWSVSAPTDSQEFYALFEEYINQRHHDGGMYPASLTTYREFLVSDHGSTRFLNLHAEGRLIATMVFDQLPDGLSSVYCFYDPSFESFSIGTLMILRLTQMAAGLGLPFNYLGYWVRDCAQMNYKGRFSPLEFYKNGAWQPVTDDRPLP